MKAIYGAGGLVLALLVLAVLYWFYKRGAGGVAKDTASATIEAAGGLAAGVVQGVSRTIGIPDISQNKCNADIAAGDNWSASFDCPAGVFVKNLFGPKFSTQPLTGTTP